MTTHRIAASILNADFGRLAEQVQEVEAAGADLIHVDVMDGRFVPNITLGFVVVEAVRRSTSLPLDVHLMIEQPQRYFGEFARAGATYLTVHHEATDHLHRAVVEIKNLGMRAGVALNPATPLSAVEEIVGDLDLLLIMGIDPGFGGQSLIASTADKLMRARRLLEQASAGALLSVDGGVKAQNIGALAHAGADTLVVGTGIFLATGGIAAGVTELRDALARRR